MAGNLEQQANYFKSIPLLQRNIIASVHLEDMEDQKFCDAVLQKVKSGTYYYIAKSRNGNSHLASGCEQCLAYRPFLDKHFFVFIDSDMRYIKQEVDIDVCHYICQTYTYSWENHYCEAIGLQQRFEEIKGHKNFDFVSFLSELSEIVFEPLVVLLYCLKNELEPFTSKQLFGCIPTQCRRDELLENGKAFLSRIRTNFKNMISSFQSYDMSEEVSELNALGITIENAYLHVRGHNLFDMVAYVGKLLCRNSQISFYNDILVKNIPEANYWELQRVDDDAQQILS